MQKLQTKLAEIRKIEKAKRPALMTHVVLGYPSLKESIAIVKAMADSGASIIELQIPFSDPMADGPTIMAANEAALKNGLKVKDCFAAAEKLAKELPNTPLLFMSYFNILYCYNKGKNGVRNFFKDTQAAGVSGVIVPDIPAEDTGEEFWSDAKKFKVAPIPVVSPVSTEDRLKLIKKVTQDSFVYCVSTTGTTGARKDLPPDIKQYLSRVRKIFNQPLAVGFGISTREQVEVVGQHAEIAIVGSAMVDKIKSSSSKDLLKVVSKFTKELLF
ncbi:MAG: tryptophan synthase subunit alpha [Proteobacteria bacterium]|nr:tryptophan synthase subunit alpha [Pseudomonadota bacterium]